MAILVDPAIWRWRGRRWAHLISDESYDELHAFASRLGLHRALFQGDHYDIPADVREQAIALGAKPVAGRELVARLHTAGLRRRRRLRSATGGPTMRPDVPQAEASLRHEADPDDYA